jgi:hypothetical protein
VSTKNGGITGIRHRGSTVPERSGVALSFRGRPFSPSLRPDLHRAIAPQVGIPHVLDFQDQKLIAASTTTTQCRVTKLHRMPAVTRRGDPQNAADRLDPETVTMLIDKCPQDLVRRQAAGQSSSAWANTRWPVAGSRRPCAVRDSRAPRPLCTHVPRWSGLGAGPHRFDGGESNHAGFARSYQS